MWRLCVLFLVITCGGVAADCSSSNSSVALDVLGQIVGFFVPVSAGVQWQFVLLAGFFTKNVYIQYLFLTEAWFDASLGRALAAAWPAYCGAMQAHAAFFATALAHHIFYGNIPLPLYSFTVLLFALVLALLNVLGSCACTLVGVAAAVAVGAALSVLRILFYYEIIYLPYHSHPRQRLQP